MGDRVRIAELSGFDDFQTCLALSTSAPTQWITAEHLSYAEEPDYGSGFVSSEDDILPVIDHGHEHSGLTRVIVSARAVCDISRAWGC